MPYHYSVYKRLINEVKQRVPNLSMEKRDDEKSGLSVLDYGAGLGSGLWAAMHMYG